MMHEITLAWSDVRICQCLVNLKRLGFYPLSVFVVQSLLCYFPDIYLWIEISGESFMMVSRIAVNDVKIVDFIEMMLCSVCCIYTGHTWVETASKYCRQPCLFKLVLICPLPWVFEMCLVLWFVVGSIEVVYSTCKTSFHNGQVLIWKSQIDNQFRLVVTEQSL